MARHGSTRHCSAPLEWLDGRQKLKAAVSHSSGKPSTLSLSVLEMARGYVSAEMNVFLLIRVSLEVQERIGVIQVAVLIVCEAKDWSGVSRMLIHP